MVVKIKNKEMELKYSFNSFKYMEDFDISVLGDIQTKPFKMVGLIETLMMGAVNYNPKVRISREDVQKYLEEFMDEDGDITTLLEELMGLLEKSSFFKSLQKN